MDPHRDNTRGGFANREVYPGVEEIVYDPATVRVPDYLTDLPAVRQELAQYYQAISRMDQGVGKVLGYLKEAGFENDTLVMFVSDNGPPFLNSKTTLYDAGVRLPLIVRSPSCPRGTINPTLVSWIDILPTFLDIAESLSIPTRDSRKKPAAPIRNGRSLLPILSEAGAETSSGWTEVYGSHTFHELTNYYPTRFLRTSRYKYHRNICWKLDFPFSADIYASKSWEAIRDSASSGDDIKIGHRTLANYLRRGPEELFDVVDDPLEVHNLASKPEYAKMLLDFRGKVQEWQRHSDDPWLFKDGVSVRSMSQYIGEGGWDIQDRFDFELAKPGSGPH